MKINNILSEIAKSLFHYKKVVLFKVQNHDFVTFDSVTLYYVPNASEIFNFKHNINDRYNNLNVYNHATVALKTLPIHDCTIGTKSVEYYKTSITEGVYDVDISVKACKYFQSPMISYNKDTRIFEIFENGLLVGLVAPLMHKRNNNENI